MLPSPLLGPFIIYKVSKTDLIFSKLGFFIVLENIKTIMRLVRSSDCAITVVFFRFFFSTSSFSWKFVCFIITFVHSKSTLVWMWSPFYWRESKLNQNKIRGIRSLRNLNVCTDWLNGSHIGRTSITPHINQSSRKRATVLTKLVFVFF